jgi:hypothetical protein
VRFIFGGIVVMTALVAVFGMPLALQGLENHRARARRPKIPAPGTNGRGGIYKSGCKDCGTEVEWRWTTMQAPVVLDYYDRCEYCADLEELYGGVKSMPARFFTGMGYDLSRAGEPGYVLLDLEDEPPADISGIHMEMIR